MPKKYTAKDWQKKIDKAYGWNKYTVEYVSFDGSRGIDSKLRCNKCKCVFTTNLSEFTYTIRLSCPSIEKNSCSNKEWITKYNTAGKDKGIKWVGTELPETTSAKTQWQCYFGHKWSTTYSHINAGSGCPYCARVSEEQYYCVGIDKGIKWVGTELPETTGTKTQWQCSFGHEWSTTYDNIKQGNGCPYCAKVSEEQYRTIGIPKGIKWFSTVLPKNTLTITQWQCSFGHVYPDTYSKIQQKHGCPICWFVSKEDYNCAGIDKGIKWVGIELPANTLTKTQWQCTFGHEWPATYDTINQGSGCPDCYESTGEAAIRTLIERLNIRFVSQYKFPHFPNNRMSFDFYIPSLDLAIEFNGAQHYRPIRFGGITVEEAELSFANQIERDKVKKDFCTEYKHNFWVISSDEPNWLEKLERKLLKYI